MNPTTALPVLALHFTPPAATKPPSDAMYTVQPTPAPPVQPAMVTAGQNGHGEPPQAVELSVSVTVTGEADVLARYSKLTMAVEVVTAVEEAGT